MKRVGVVGARGHVGSELLPMLRRHPNLELAWVVSSGAVGEPVPNTDLRYVAPDPALLDDVDVAFLALPNGESAAWAARAGETVLVDLSADHRFDSSWVYAQPERFRAQLFGARRLSCPGCYATAAQLAVAPLADLTSAVHCFGVSGFSGAGTSRSERNDPAVLQDNLLPYAMVGHTHERELAAHLPLAPCFIPHVAQFFRGLSVTSSFEFLRPVALAQLEARYAEAYAAEPFVEVLREPPRPRDSVGRHDVRIGGLSLAAGGRHAVVVSALDNLLGGAASQAMRAMNLALGFEQGLGLVETS